jgi:hypothetical protein
MILRRKSWLSLAIAASFILGALPASANILSAEPEMGDLLRWGAFSLGGSITDTSTATNLSGSTDNIFGDVGVAGSGNITMSGNATIHGNLYYRSNGTLTKSGKAKITGAIFHSTANDMTDLDPGVTEANNTDTSVNGQSDSMNYTYTVNNGLPQTSLTNVNGNQNIVLSGPPGMNVRLQLSNFIRTGGTFTLSGSASTNFIINVRNQFSLSNGAKIVLTGGVTWDNVLFNVHGTGSDVALSGNSSMVGILMATKRTVSISGGSTVGQRNPGGPRGEVIANKITISNGEIVHVSP